jgi:elongation factor P
MNYGDLRRGTVIRFEGDLYTIVEVEHITPGNWRAMCQIKMKNLKTGNVQQRRFRPQDKAEDVFVEKREMEYLYKDASGYIFMDLESYEQAPIPADVVGEETGQWLTPNMHVMIASYDGQIIGINLPDTVEMMVKETDPVVKGQTATNQYKPAVLENGVRAMVPPFIEKGERIRIDTRDGKYLERAK